MPRPVHPKREEVLDRWSRGETTPRIQRATGVCVGSIASMLRYARERGDERAVRRNGVDE